MLLLILLSLCSRTTITPLSRRCRTSVALAQRGYKQFKIEVLLLYYHSTVASAVDQKVHTVVASRGTIKVTVTIGDCQMRVSSSSEGCSTLQKNSRWKLEQSPLSHRYLIAIAPVLLHCCSAAVAPDVATQSHRYRTVVTLLSNRYYTAIAPLLLRCCCSCC